MELLDIFKMEEPISKELLVSRKLKTRARILDNSSRTKPDADLLACREEVQKLRIENNNLTQELLECRTQEIKYKNTIDSLQKKMGDSSMKRASSCNSAKSSSSRERLMDHIRKLEDHKSRIERRNEEMEVVIERLNEKNRDSLRQNDLLKSYKEQVENLQKQVEELKEANKLMAHKSPGDTLANEFEEIMQEYNAFISRIVHDKDDMLKESMALRKHAENLEFSFQELMQKYEKAKVVIEGLQLNERMLKEQFDNVPGIIEELQQKYNELRDYAERKINQANYKLINSDKDNIEETAKLKAKILQSQLKISELEKHVNGKKRRY